MRYKSIIFDLDDTLIQSFQTLTSAYINVGKSYGLDITVDIIKSYWGRPAEEVILGILENADTLENLQEKLTENLPNGMIPPFDGAIDLINELSTTYTLGIVTASIAKFTPLNLIKAGFDIDKFQFVHKVEDTKFHKPDPRVFDEALELLDTKFNIGKKEVLFVGDSLHDLQAADGRGIDYLIVNTGPTTIQTLLEHNINPSRVINKLNELRNYLYE